MPASIEYPTRDGAIAYAYFYPPRNLMRKQRLRSGHRCS
jgi:hypothetical protein